MLPCPLSTTPSAQTRDRALRSAAIFDKERVAGERLRLEALRETTKDLSPTQRLTARITYCRELLLWLSELRQPEGSDGRAWQRCVSDRDLLSKLIAQCEAPEAGDRVRSAADPDARRGRHGSFYDGYRTAVLVDPDSEIVTNINVQPANSEEAANILALVREEEAAHGTDIQGVSIDGAGWSGPVLRELQDPDDLNINVTVPPPAESSVLFTAEKFPLSEDGQHVTCPAGNYTHDQRAYSCCNCLWAGP